jgi:hypothetical protein
MYVFFTAGAGTVQCLCVGRVMQCAACLLVTFPFFFCLYIFFGSFHFLVVQTVESVYWLESASINYVIEC